ncbi:MAG: potassium channel protein [Novosphingobium sp.]|nr:potassium channel protein [Novosphingobium sp.]MBO9603952.1 potassium channel protein [Novosphingobium sp.]
MALKGIRAQLAAQTSLGSPTQNLVRAALFVCLVYVLSTAGFLASGWSLADAFFMVTITIFSVGYGEVHPLDTAWLRLLDETTIIFGCIGMIVLTGALVQAFSHYQVVRLLGIDRMEKQIEKLSGHTIICGLGRIGHQLAKELAGAASPFIIVERDTVKLAEARALGYLCLTGDATDEGVLEEAGIARARVLATVLPNDAANVFITLSARNMNPALEIIARGEVPSTESKLIHAGANQVVLPAHIGAERIAEQILYPATHKYIGNSPHLREIKRGLRDFGLEIEVVTVPEGGALTGLTIAEAEQRSRGAFFVIHLDRADGTSFPHPPETEIVGPGDTVVLVMRGSKVGAGALFSAARQKVRVGRGGYAAV